MSGLGSSAAGFAVPTLQPLLEKVEKCVAVVGERLPALLSKNCGGGVMPGGSDGGGSTPVAAGEGPRNSQAAANDGGPRKRADRATSSEGSDSGIGTPVGSSAASDVASLEPCSPLSNCSDAGESRPRSPPMPPSQPAHPWHARLGHSTAAPPPPPTPLPAQKRRSRSQGDSPPEPAEEGHTSERAAKRRRRASSDEHRLRLPPPPPLSPPPPPPAEPGTAHSRPVRRPPPKPHVQEKITDYFTKHIKHISAQAFRDMKKEFLSTRPTRPVLQLGDDTAEVPVPEGRLAQRDALLRALKRRNGVLHTPAALSTANVCATEPIVSCGQKRVKDATSVRCAMTTASRSVASVTAGKPARSVTSSGKDVPSGGKDVPSGGKDVPSGGKDVPSGGKAATCVSSATPTSAAGDRLPAVAGVTSFVASPAEMEEATTACRTPSETSSVDSGLGKDRVSEPSTPSEPLFEPPVGPVVRFPARERASAGSAFTCCQWLDCGDRLSSQTQLLDHLQSQHVPRAAASGSSSGAEASRSHRCLWQGCKVYDRPGSAAWLERHVLTHGGSKPFRCIVDGCSHRFASQSMLERHVNHHFKHPAAPLKRSDSCAKAGRRSGRRAPLEEHPHSARIFDFCDPSAMERMRYQLVSADEALETLPPIDSRSVQLTAQVIARRMVTANKPEVLVRWRPADVLDDEWVPVHEFRPSRRLGCSQLPAHVWQRLASAVGAPSTSRRRRRKPGS